MKKNNDSAFKSIFDIIEERSDFPCVFGWSDSASLCKFTDENFLFEGRLIILEGNPPRPKPRRCVLTHKALIRYKVELDVKENDRNRNQRSRRRR